jgi:hypothetical protein
MLKLSKCYDTIVRLIHLLNEETYLIVGRSKTKITQAQTYVVLINNSIIIGIQIIKHVSKLMLSPHCILDELSVADDSVAIGITLIEHRFQDSLGRWQAQPSEGSLHLSPAQTSRIIQVHLMKHTTKHRVRKILACRASRTDGL